MRPSRMARNCGLITLSWPLDTRSMSTKLMMIHSELRAEIQTDMAIPVLSHWFESSVAGLYFVGLTSLRALGPLYRFVAGCGPAARRVASSVARNRAGRARSIAVPRHNRRDAVPTG